MIKDFPKEDELVFCTVEKIIGTSVFCNIDDYNKQGVISFSEVSPGRIRNIRDYVFPKKRIVCKVLRIDKKTGHVDLSLRRVDSKSKKEMFDKYKREKSSREILKIVFENPEEAERKIKEKFSSLYEFLEKLRKNPDLGKNFFKKQEAEKLLKIVQERIKEKIYKIRAEILIESDSENAIDVIKSVSSFSTSNIRIYYKSSPYYTVEVQGKNYKEVSRKLHETVEKIINNLKKQGARAELIRELKH